MALQLDFASRNCATSTSLFAMKEQLHPSWKLSHQYISGLPPPSHLFLQLSFQHVPWCEITLVLDHKRQGVKTSKPNLISNRENQSNIFPPPKISYRTTQHEQANANVLGSKRSENCGGTRLKIDLDLVCFCEILRSKSEIRRPILRQLVRLEKPSQVSHFAT